MADNTEQAIVENQSYSVRQFSPNSWGGFIGDNLGFLWPSTANTLPAWGTTECDIALRLMHYTQHNALWGGAVQAWLEKFLSIPYEISGGRNLTLKWQDIFFESEFGEGYDELVSKGLVDYLTLNRGWFMELVSYGSPDTPIKEGARILGINHLDALRIIMTGNREWPYLYQSEWGGGLHKMHYTRVLRTVRQSSPNTLMYGMGKSALYDSLTVANAETMLGRHENELLNDLPPPGIVIFNNVKADEVATAMKQFEYERVRDGQNIYRAPLSLSSKDPSQPATVTFVPMSTVPQGFDKDKYTRIHVNIIALNLGLDPQDVWPLEGSAMGSGEQSKVLAAKTDTKGPGQMATRLTRRWNVTLPRSLEWKYKAQNAAQDKETANLAKLWTDMANSATFMTEDEKRQLAANQIAAFSDVLRDEAGDIRLFDVDPKEDAQIMVATDSVEGDTSATGAEDVTTNSENEEVVTDETPTEPVSKAKITRKDIDATAAEFIDEIMVAMQNGIDRSVTKAGTAARIRGLIQRYGKFAYQDGLEVGGVDGGELDEDDKLKISDIALHNSQYVTDLVNEIYSDAGMKGTPETRAPLWVSTTNEFYYAGAVSADGNAMYEFIGDDGIENCTTCKTLKGQKHRLKEWLKRELVPGKDHHNFECGSWEPNCAHTLAKTTGKAKGNWV